MGRTLLAIAFVFTLALAPAFAEDVEKKWRLGVSAGFFNTTDTIESDAANILILEDDANDVVQFYLDPRNDSAVFGNLDVKSGPMVNLHVQYAVTKIFLIEASVGYFKGDLGDVEVQAQFANTEVPDTQDFAFQAFRVPVGEVERVPISFSALARFRPRASFNPYVGGGIGYAIVGFETDPAFDTLSENMDASLGRFARVSGSLLGNAQLISTGNPVIDLQGARVDATDTFEWHMAGGAEYSFKRKWSAYVDFRWTLASRSVEVGFNGDDYLGAAVPNLRDFETSEIGVGAANGAYGAMNIVSGGLIDGGRTIVVPIEGAPIGTNCGNDPNPPTLPTNCTFLFINEPDGELDTGFYYVQGGKVDLDGFSATAGVRFTF